MAIAVLESDQYRKIFIASRNQAEAQFSHYLQSLLDLMQIDQIVYSIQTF